MEYNLEDGSRHIYNRRRWLQPRKMPSLGVGDVRMGCDVTDGSQAMIVFKSLLEFY